MNAYEYEKQCTVEFETLTVCIVYATPPWGASPVRLRQQRQSLSSKRSRLRQQRQSLPSKSWRLRQLLRKPLFERWRQRKHPL
eukprot:scaffold30111_cov43-Cyclotella_meneghiniana.AAC.5